MINTGVAEEGDMNMCLKKCLEFHSNAPRLIVLLYKSVALNALLHVQHLFPDGFFKPSIEAMMSLYREAMHYVGKDSKFFVT